MKVGRSYKWYYDKGEWKKTRITLICGKYWMLLQKDDKKNTIVERHFEKREFLFWQVLRVRSTLHSIGGERFTRPLLDEVNYDFLRKSCLKRRTTFKAFLLDQNNIHGNGNAYVGEILRASKIILNPNEIKFVVTESKL